MRAFGLALLVGCRAAPVPPTIIELPTVDPSDAEPWVEPWVRTEEWGEVFIDLHGETPMQEPFIEVSALFGSGIEGADYPSACALRGDLCAVSTGMEVGVPLDAEVQIGRSSWLGDTVQVGDIPLAFTVDQTEGTGGYTSLTIDELALPTRLDLVFSRGEWGSGRAQSAVRRPDPLSGLEPSPLEPVEVGDARFAQFQWTPVDGGGQMWLTARGNGVELARPVADDGSALVDVSQVRWTGPMEVQLWRIASDVRTVNDNTLVVRTASHQSWCVVDTCGGPRVPSWPAYLSFSFRWSPSNEGSSQWQLTEDGRWQTSDGFGGTWSYDCCSGELRFTFGSGTEYWGVLDSDGCVEGEMLSWSGSQGTWSGCL